MDNQISHQGKKILVVEDEHFITELYTRALTKAGYQVTNVSDGDKALKLARTNDFDVILLDIMIPQMLGVDILHVLRDEMPNLKAKIIISTNLEQDEKIRAAIEREADGYLIKAEITPRQLVAFLDKLKF
jgi:DNA-binding response OmpR family regulator